MTCCSPLILGLECLDGYLYFISPIFLTIKTISQIYSVRDQNSMSQKEDKKHYFDTLLYVPHEFKSDNENYLSMSLCSSDSLLGHDYSRGKAHKI